DNARAQEEIADAVAGKKEFNSEFRVVWPNGEIRTIRAIAVSQKDESGKVISLIGTNWDVSELKRAKEELFRNEESFLGAFDNSAAGMALVSKEGWWIKVNDSLCKSIGYTREELKKIHFKEFTHPEDLPRDLRLWKELLDGERSSYQIEKRYYHKKGHLIHVVITVTAVKDIYGDFSHCITQIMDITSRKEAEKKLTSLVEITKDQNASLLNFAHIVSHNLRSHATNLSMLSGFLKDEKDAVEQKNLSIMMSNATESLNETVAHLNEVVQVKTGALEKMTRVNLLPTITGVKSNINAMLKEKGAVCTLKINKSHAVQAVPAYLESILLNLFTNALKYSSPDRKPTIYISSGLYKNYVVLKFSDNGQGIDLERHGKKLFGMYKTFHEHKDARGIGLFITKNQIESMNGKIEVTSEVGVGTTFTLYFEKGNQ
ncbi:MAG: PAS domain S-box protein, partial [Muriicola sp.]|nr:PAS domain S-box protein [Muriicola sp.]